jgi:WD40 repeat protein
MASASGYDAFVSYSHQHDAVLASSLQTALERFAKPWYLMRAVRIFRDSANLAANPALWRSIEDALNSSQWFILLASIDAAESGWVNREVEWWLAHHSPERVLVVATSPGLAWDKQKGDWATGAPVPPALRHAFADEPLWVDLSDPQFDSRRPQIPPGRLADLAAAIRGVPKDAIVGENLRQHRRTVRLARGAVAVLAALTALAVVAAIIAVDQRDTARTQARLATSRELAALAVSNLSTRLDVAQLLAVGAYRMDANPQTQGALLQAVAASPHLVRFLQVGGPVTALAASADGNAVVAGTADGRLVWFGLPAGRRAEVVAGRDSITAVAVSADGRTVVATSGSGAVFWPVGARRAVPVDVGQSVTSVAISPSGEVTAILVNAGTPSASVLLRYSGSNDEARIGVLDPYTNVAFPSDSTLTAIGGSTAEEWSLPSLHVLVRSSALLLPAGGYILGTSSNGQYAGFSKYGNVDFWSTRNTQDNGYAFSVAPAGVASDLEIGSDGRSVALVSSGTIYVAQVSLGQRMQTATNITPLTGGGDVTSVRFLGSGNQLVSSSGTSLELWNLRQASRLGQSTGISIPDAGTIGAAPDLAFSADGRWLATAVGVGLGVSTYHNGSHFTLARRNANIGLPLWRGDELFTFGVGSNGLMDLTDEHGRVLASWGGLHQYEGTPYVRLLPGQEQIAAINSYGGVLIYNLATKTVRQVYADQEGLENNTLTVFQHDISPDGSAAVMTEWRSDTLTSPLTPLSVLYVNLRTGASHTVGSGGADAAVFTSSRLLIQRSTGTLEIWDLSGEHLLRTLQGSGGYTFGLAISPSGTLLARLRDDGTATITDVTTGQVLASFNLPFPSSSSAVDPWNATTLTFTPDGQELLTATSGGEMTRWNIATSALIRNACAIAGRNLSAAEWRDYTQTNPPSDPPCTDGSGG